VQRLHAVEEGTPDSGYRQDRSLWLLVVLHNRRLVI
jgi:hypothetical protein